MVSSRPVALRHVTQPAATSLTSDDALVQSLVEASVAPATRRAYTADWDRFATWCSMEAVDPLLAGPEHVAGYLAQASAVVSADGSWAVAVATLQRWVSGLNQVHAASGGAVPGRSELVRRTLAGIRRTRATPATRRRPLRLTEIRSIVRIARDNGTTWTEQIRARRDSFVLLAGHLGAFRAAELVRLSVGDVQLAGDHGLQVLVRSSKTDQLASGMTKGLPRTTAADLCPVCAWWAWRQLLDAHDDGGRPAVITALTRGPVVAEGEHLCRSVVLTERDDPRPLVRRLWQSGWLTEAGLTPDTVKYLVKQRASAAGMSKSVVDRLGAHSLRAGFVTDAYAAGAGDGEVMRQTGHRSITQVRAYQRDAPLVGNAVTRLDPDRP